MNIFFITIEAVFTLLGLGVMGFWIIGRRRVSGETLGFLSALAIDIALPCLVLSSLINDFSPQNNPDWSRMPLWWIGFVSLSLPLSLLCSLMVSRTHRCEFAMGLFYQNAIFFPLVILTGVFGPHNPYLVTLILVMFLHPTMIFSTYPLFFLKKNVHQGFNMARIFNPIIVSTIVGIALALIGIQSYVPGFIKRILIMVGAMVAPLFMLILGGNLYHDFVMEAKEKRKLYFREVFAFILAKNILFPLVALGILILIKPTFPIALIIMLEAAVPPVTSIPILAQRSGGNRSLSSQFIVASFLFSIISIPLALYLFSRFFPFSW
jgi:predicted permease